MSAHALAAASELLSGARDIRLLQPENGSALTVQVHPLDADDRHNGTNLVSQMADQGRPRGGSSDRPAGLGAAPVQDGCEPSGSSLHPCTKPNSALAQLEIEIGWYPRKDTDMLMTQAAFARHRCISKQRINQHVRDGQIDGDALVPKNGKILIDSDRAEAQLARRLDPMKVIDQSMATKRKRRPAEITSPEPPASASLEDALATIVAEAPSNAAWAALSLGVEPWRALAIFENTQMDIIGETRLTFGIELDVSSFETVNWSGALAQYRPGETVDIPAWRSQIASFEATQEAAEKNSSPKTKLPKRAAAAVR